VKTKEISEHNKERLQAISEFLREYRISNGYSQLEISEIANLSRNSLVRMESKRPENINLLTVFAVCDALSLDVNQVFFEIQ
jgi:DNA-binding XRE family transcriptional regulator